MHCLSSSSLQNPRREALLCNELRRRDSRAWIGWSLGSGARTAVAIAVQRLGVEAAEILSVSVRVDWRRGGVGRTLVERSLEETRRAGPAMLQLEVRARLEPAGGGALACLDSW